MLEQKVKAAWRAFIAAKDPSADVSERAWEDLHFTERNAWFSAFRVFVVPTDDPQPVQQCALCGEGEAFTGSCGGGRDNPRALCYTAQPQPVQQPVAWSERIKELADQYAIECVEFSKGIPNGAHSISPIAVKAGDTRLALHSAIDTGERFIRAIESATLAAQVEGATQPQPVQEPLGFMNAGHVHEMQQGRLPYGYVYPKDGAGASVAVYTSPQAAQPLSDEQIAEMCGDANRGYDIDFDDYRKAVKDTESAHGITKGTT